MRQDKTIGRVLLMRAEGPEPATPDPFRSPDQTRLRVRNAAPPSSAAPPATRRALATAERGEARRMIEDGSAAELGSGGVGLVAKAGLDCLRLGFGRRAEQADHACEASRAAGKADGADRLHEIPARVLGPVIVCLMIKTEDAQGLRRLSVSTGGGGEVRASGRKLF